MTTAAIPDSANAVPEGHWTDVLRHDAAIHIPLMLSIVAGTFQAYLKDRIGGFFPYLLADGFFGLAVALWFAALAIRHAPLRGPGRALAIILAVIIAPAFYLLAPGTPLLIQAAGLRTWSAFPLAALLGLSIVRNAGQVRAYVGLILALCIITAIYGVVQYRAGPGVVTAAGSLALLRHGTSTAYYVASANRFEFRAFSTFTYPAPFAGMMVFGMLLAAGAAVSRHYQTGTRILSAALILLFFVGMTVSGTRAALVTFALGAFVIAWYRGIGIRQLLLVPVALIGLHIATVLTAGRIIERYTTLVAEESTLWLYVLAPVTTAARALSANWLGLGLGRSGVGVPFFIFNSMPASFFVGSDGDIGRGAVELGLVGLALLALIIFGLLPLVLKVIKDLRHTAVDDLGLGAGSLVLATGVLLLIGSPLSAVPHGTIWWFLLGALLKLRTLYAPADASAA